MEFEDDLITKVCIYDKEIILGQEKHFATIKTLSSLIHLYTDSDPIQSGFSHVFVVYSEPIEIEWR